MKKPAAVPDSLRIEIVEDVYAEMITHRGASRSTHLLEGKGRRRLEQLWSAAAPIAKERGARQDEFLAHYGETSAAWGSGSARVAELDNFT